MGLYGALAFEEKESPGIPNMLYLISPNRMNKKYVWENPSVEIHEEYNS